MFAAGSVVLSPVEMEVHEIERAAQATARQRHRLQRVVGESGGQAVAIIGDGECLQLIVVGRKSELGHWLIDSAASSNVDRRLRRSSAGWEQVLPNIGPFRMVIPVNFFRLQERDQSKYRANGDGETGMHLQYNVLDLVDLTDESRFYIWDRSCPNRRKHKIFFDRFSLLVSRNEQLSTPVFFLLPTHDASMQINYLTSFPTYLKTQQRRTGLHRHDQNKAFTLSIKIENRPSHN